MFGLSFLSPLFLAGVAAIAIPIAIHLFYRKVEPVIEFSAMRYLRRAPVEESKRRRLRELLLLALRVSALLLLALAFARPYLSEASGLAASATMILVDTSASLSGPGQFDRVRARAADAVRGAPPTHAVGVMTFAGSAELVAPLSEDRAGAVAAVAALKPGAGASRYRAALRQAADELDGRSGRIVVVTDLQQNAWDATGDGGVPESVEVELEDVSGPTANVAVTSLRREGADAVAVVHNYSTVGVTEQVVFALDGRRLGAAPLTMPAGGTSEARLTLPEAPSGALSAAITDRDGFAVDNVRYAVIDPADTPEILAVTATGHPSEALYLERALAIAEGPEAFRFRAVSGQTFSDTEFDGIGTAQASSTPAANVVVVAGSRGLERRGRERLGQFARSGGGLLVTTGPDVDADVIKEALSGVMTTSWRLRDDTAPLTFAAEDGRHPVFRLFAGAGTLGNVSFSRTALLEVGSGARILARYSDGTPALVEESRQAGRVLVFASDLNNLGNDFPLQPAFVPFVHETLRYLVSTLSARTEYLVGELPGTQGLMPGVVTRAGRQVALNVDPRESDPARMTEEAFQAGIIRLNAAAAQQAGVLAREQEDRQRLWQYGLLLMLLSLTAEGILGRRMG